VAETVYCPSAAGATNAPVTGSIEPPVADQITAGNWPGSGSSNWSSGAAENDTGCRGSTRSGPAGVTASRLNVGATTTVTADTADRPPVSATRTLSTYVPALEKVAVAALAPLVPLSLKVGAAAPSGTVVADHV
jgi:hypothetical protein